MKKFLISFLIIMLFMMINFSYASSNIGDKNISQKDSIRQTEEREEQIQENEGSTSKTNDKEATVEDKRTTEESDLQSDSSSKAKKQLINQTESAAKLTKNTTESATKSTTESAAKLTKNTTESATKSTTESAVKSTKSTTETISEKIVPSRTIEDGEYEIRAAINTNRVLDIDRGLSDSGARVQIWDDSDVLQQRFIVKYIGDGYYKITVRHSGKSMDVSNAGKENGTKIQQYDSNNTDAQKWIINKTDDGKYNIISKCNGLYATTTQNQNGSALLMYESNGGNSQKFVFDKVLKDVGTKTITDGEYEIRTAINNNKVLDIDGGSSASGARLQIWDDSDVFQQRFIVKYLENGYYKITVRHSGKALDVSGADIKERTKVQQYDGNGTDAQQWIIKKTSDGLYNIISKCNGLYLTVTGNSNGSSIVTNKSNNTTSQKFAFDKVLKDTGTKTIADGEYKIRTSKDNSKVFDIDGGSSTSGARLQIWSDCNVKQQRYYVKYLGNGFYKLTVRHSGKVLDVSGADIKEKTKVQQYDGNGTDAQQWIIKKTSDGFYNIISKCNGLYLTVTGNNNGSSIVTNKSSNSALQKFVFERIEEEKGTKTIDDGEYEIRTVINNNKVLDIDGGSSATGARLQIWDDSEVLQQRFIIQYMGNGYYKMTAKHSGKVLDVIGGEMIDGKGIQQFDNNNTDAQRWIIRKNSDNTYSIISKGTGLYLTLENDMANNGTKILTYGKKEGNSQKFTFEKISEERGIDVSSHQKDIDWSAVKQSGIDFVMIRVGYRGYGTGRIVYDSKFNYNIENALKNGLKCGVYFYTQAVNEDEAREEADFVINAVRNYNLTYPIALDSERANGSGRADNLSVEDRTKICKAFCDRIKQNGYRSMIYASKFWFYDNLDRSQLGNNLVWLAHYVNDAPKNKSDYDGKYYMWQYTSKGSIPGIEGNVDLDIKY